MQVCYARRGVGVLMALRVEVPGIRGWSSRVDGLVMSRWVDLVNVFLQMRLFHARAWPGRGGLALYEWRLASRPRYGVDTAESAIMQKIGTKEERMPQINVSDVLVLPAFLYRLSMSKVILLFWQLMQHSSAIARRAFPAATAGDGARLQSRCSGTADLRSLNFETGSRRYSSKIE
jgi:hypothetical protein